MEKKEHKVIKGSGSNLFMGDHLQLKKRAKSQELLQIILVLKPQTKHQIITDRKASAKTKKASFIKRYKLSKKANSKILEFTTKFDLNVDSIISEIGIIYLTGTIGALEKAFKVELHNHEYKDEITRYKQKVLGHKGKHYIPKKIKHLVSGVIGLTHVPLMHHSVPLNPIQQSPSFSAAKGMPASWFADYYDFPAQYDGDGQNIGIISCGGGIRLADIRHYFNELYDKYIPKIKFVPVNGIKNNPGKNFMYDFELATDCLVCLSAAPAIQLKVYSTTNSLKGFSDAILQIIKERKNRPSIISYSWGASESFYSLNEIKGVNRILMYATLVKEISILSAAGDKGSTNNYESNEDSPLEVQFPTSSPWITSCGGTMIKTTEKGKLLSEDVWNSPNNLYDILLPNATGGGFSKYIKQPDYQEGWLEDQEEKYPIGMRGVPDISAHADMSPGGIAYWIRVNGKYWVSGGTSAVAPLIAALIARLNQACETHIGFLNPHLYEMAKTDAINEVVKGNNAMPNGPKFWAAKRGWNPCAGLGVPNGEKMLKYLNKMHTK